MGLNSTTQSEITFSPEMALGTRDYPQVDVKCLTYGLIGHDCFLGGWKILTGTLGEKEETSNNFSTALFYSITWTRANNTYAIHLGNIFPILLRVYNVPMA